MRSYPCKQSEANYTSHSKPVILRFAVGQEKRYLPMYLSFLDPSLSKTQSGLVHPTRVPTDWGSIRRKIRTDGPCETQLVMVNQSATPGPWPAMMSMRLSPLVYDEVIITSSNCFYFRPLHNVIIAGHLVCVESSM